MLSPGKRQVSLVTVKGDIEKNKGEMMEVFDEEMKDNQRYVKSGEFILAHPRKIIFAQESKNIRLNNVLKLPASYPKILKQPPKKV